MGIPVDERLEWTLADLEKLEALHAAATPGEWKGDRNDGTVKYRLQSEDCDCDSDQLWDCPHVVLAVDHKNVTSGFLGRYGNENEKLVIALHNAFPTMAKALREALIQRDEAYRERADWMHSLDRAKADIVTLMRERDKALMDAAQNHRDTIEAERRVDEVMNAVRAASGGGDAKSMEETIRAAGAKIEQLRSRVFMLEAERDDARREAAQLREIVKTAGDRLRACAYELTEFSHQEMADALFDLPASAEVAP